MYLRPFAIGAATFVPGVTSLLTRKGTGSAASATYCYEVWLKHLTLLWANGMRRIPYTLAELGPGDSLGVGLAAMLCGVDRYYGLDAVPYSSTKSNLAVFEELVALVRARTPRVRSGWPDYDAHLDARLFPSHILTDERLERSLAADRIRRIRERLASMSPQPSGNLSIQYKAPWMGEAAIERESVDVVISHAVLQSVLDLDETYAALDAWLKPGGYMSHQIDFTSFRTAQEWNGHWAYPDAVWKVIVGRRPYLINREPHSTHVELIKRRGLTLVCDLQNYAAGPAMKRSRLAARWRNMTDDDFACSGAFIQARKA